MTPASIPILLVDDDESIRETTADLLMLSGFHVITASGAHEAIAALDRERVELILSDIVMPKGDGYELLAHVRSHPNLQGIPLVLISAKADKPDIRKGMVEGADDYLTKPFQADELIAVIQNQLQKRNARRSEITQLKRQLAQVIPHELRTPLTGVLGYAELLNEIALDTPADVRRQINQACESLRQSGVRIQRLVERVELWLELETEPGLLLARARQEPTLGWTERARLLFAVFAESAGRSQDLSIQLQEAPIAVPSRYLMEALAGFAENAINSSPAGSPLSVTGHAEQTYYHLVIRYTGAPWPTGQVQRLDSLIPFDRDHSDQQSLGLGLAIGCKLCQLLGTQPEIRNEDGRTEATFLFPLQSAGPQA